MLNFNNRPHFNAMTRASKPNIDTATKLSILIIADQVLTFDSAIAWTF